MPPTKGAHISHFNLKIDGAQAPKELMDQILECTVDNSIHLPDMCTIRLHDAKFKYIDEAVLDPGKKIEIFASNEQMPTLVKIFCGEVTGIDVDLPADMTPTLTVRAFDYAHRLQRGRSTRTFNQMTDTDIVNKVAQEAGFTAHADSTSQVHEWIIQKNESNWEFLKKRADKNGYRLYVHDEKDLYFCKVDNDKVGPYSATGDGSGDPMHPDRQDDSAGVIKVEWGKSLRSFSPKVVASKQVKQVVVKGWDSKSKRSIVGQADTAKGVPQVGLPNNGSTTATSAYGDAKMVVTDRPVTTQQEADDLAQSVCDGIGGGYLEAEGVCFGVPTLRAGKTISIPNIGKRFSGKYHVSAVTHTYTPAEGYKTDFSVSAKKPVDLHSIISGGGSDPTTAAGSVGSSGGTGSGGGGGDNGIVIGIVTDNNDPNNQGRVKVKYPWLSEDDTTTWVRIVTPMGGSNRGFEFLPEIDDEVLVAFEHGDPHQAYILGGLWNGNDSPPYASAKAVDGGKVVRRIIRSRTGHALFFLETPEKQGFAITTAAGHKFELRDSDQFIRVITKLGNVVELNDAEGSILLKDSSGLNSIEITTEGQISLQAVGQISIQAGGAIQLKSGAATSVTSGMAFSVESGAALSLTSGAALSATSGAALALTSGAAATITSAGVATVSAAGTLVLTAPAIPMTGVVTANGMPVI